MKRRKFGDQGHLFMVSGQAGILHKAWGTEIWAEVRCIRIQVTRARCSDTTGAKQFQPKLDYSLLQGSLNWEVL